MSEKRSASRDEAPDTPDPRAAAGSTATQRLGPIACTLRWAELLALYWVIPFLIDFRERWQGRLLIPGLVVFGVVLFLWLWFDNRFDRRSLWNFAAFRRELPRIMLTSLLAFGVMIGFAWFVSEQSWAPVRTVLAQTPDGETVTTQIVAVSPFVAVRYAPQLILIICVLYPLFSVYPQEIILRTFFFHRYGPITGGGRWGTVAASALTFAWVHVLFVADKSDPLQWIPVYLCIPAGLLFGYTYMRTKSTIASGFEHAVVGDCMWIAGLGWFFFAGGAVANGG
ncbi:MAG: hypothetical protein Tsb0013_23840 [Phycisphaerales bacterium]